MNVLENGAHGGIHGRFCDITTGFLVFVFLKIVVKATLETVLVKAETFSPVLFYRPLPIPALEIDASD